jgi:hypothetical protein
MKRHENIFFSYHKVKISLLQAMEAHFRIISFLNTSESMADRKANRSFMVPNWIMKQHLKSDHNHILLGDQS